MTAVETTRTTTPPLVLPRAAELIVFALVVGHAVYLITALVQGIWVIGPGGRALDTDFVNVWAAGKLALEGTPWLAYDWPTHKIAEEAAVGHEFHGYYGWHYPPPFLFAAMALATISYSPAFLIWMAATFPLYLAAMRAIVGERTGYLLACAFPAVLANFIPGQNGFLTAGLMGAALFCIDKRPILGGIFLGLLTYKPHLGLLFPIVLAASGHWRAFFSAGVVALAMAALSLVVFGMQSWVAFFGSITQTSQAFLSDGWANFAKLQTTFGLARTLGLSETVAWAMQGVLFVIVAAAVSAIWRSRAAYEIKAAALATGALLATPYLYTYDLVAMAVPLAFLFRLGRAQGFLPYEPTGIAVACLLVLIYPLLMLPTGLLASVVVAALVVRRSFDVASHQETRQIDGAGVQPWRPTP
jgi:hypothetical protein